MSASAARKLFVNIQTKALQVSELNGGVAVLPYFNKYETVPLEIVLVELDTTATGFTKYRKLDISPLSISVAINDTFDDASPLSYQPTFVKDEESNTFSAELALNTGALNSYLGAADSKPGKFEVEIQEGTARTKVLTLDVTLQNAVTQVGAVVPSPVDEYPTKAQVAAQFMPRVGGPSEQLTLTSPNGLYQRILGVNDDGVAIDQILSV